jgi:NAD-dependent dihydropyrimidine dehydrogenase PreA subunit
MIREMVKIDEALCNGCGDCVPNCHEGALQIIDGKARLISEMMCDGLGACIGHCPMDAITIEKREADAYDEKKVMAIMAENGANTVAAHLEHLLDHHETEYHAQAIEFLTENEQDLPFSLDEVKARAGNHEGGGNHHQPAYARSEPLACGCPGSHERSFQPAASMGNDAPLQMDAPSQLSQWPIQMHLINPVAAFFRGADVVLAADCVAYAMGNFHQKYLKGKTLAIACPKLDHDPEVYIEKIRSMIDEAKINTIHIMMMEVPCCAGLRKLVGIALSKSTRKIPVKQTILGVQGDILTEEWI